VGSPLSSSRVAAPFSRAEVVVSPICYRGGIPAASGSGDCAALSAASASQSKSQPSYSARRKNLLDPLEERFRRKRL
jgi:hypothetical protein